MLTPKFRHPPLQLPNLPEPPLPTKPRINKWCLACGSNNPSMEFVKFPTPPAPTGIHDPLLVLTCRDCGYEWREVPLFMQDHNKKGINERT